MIYTKKNPKLVSSLGMFKNCETFTGVVKNKDGDIAYYLNGKTHRTDGPAIECSNDSKWWYLNGKPHREDGPAVERVIGNKEWWLNGEHYGYNNDFTNKSWIRFVRLELLK